MIKRSLFLTGPLLNKIPKLITPNETNLVTRKTKKRTKKRKNLFSVVSPSQCFVYYIPSWRSGINLEYLELRLRFSTYLGGNCVSARMNKGVPLRETVKRGAERNALKRERGEKKKRRRELSRWTQSCKLRKIKGTLSSVRLIYLII